MTEIISPAPKENSSNGAYTGIFLSLHECLKRAKKIRKNREPSNVDPLQPRDDDSPEKKQKIQMIRNFCDRFTLDATISGDPIGYIQSLPETELLALKNTLDIEENKGIAARIIGYFSNLSQEQFERLQKRYTGSVNELNQKNGFTLPSLDENPPSLTNKGINLNS